MTPNLTIKEQKRRFFLNLRKDENVVTQKLIFQEVSKYLNHFLSYQNSDGYIGIYWPLSGEIDLRSLSKCLNFSLALPASDLDGGLSYHPWKDFPLGKDVYGIPAPIHLPSLSAKDLKLLLVPALSIDKAGIRLGYGAGCFDRLRSIDPWRSIPALVVLPQACVSSNLLPCDSWDVPFNGWISETGITFCSSKNR
ncbi:5-formyltetrahydrofolate cyclo-ligase [Prochlorococcus sp. MIT 1341]|uniref:5-formyltetrahydrofolate cyclo-ligase n=1 Tax=Prochlorococcus sp. MIT 1341 TaxID=3096221 RepID=UPI002A74CA4E|nr:5-formyltetrahydrofolate cyclo-ligase [Prochlorococcus sp. MIT 1341]